MKLSYQLSGILALAILCLSGCKKDYGNQTNFYKPVIKQVKMMKLEESQDPIAITASGVLASDKEVSFSFKVGGIIDQLKVEKGEQVRKGQVLAVLDLSEINARVVQAQNGFDKAQRDLFRVENLYRDTVATLEQLQDSRTALEVSKADLDIAMFNQRYARITSLIEGKVLKKLAEEGELVSPGQPIYEIGSAGGKGAQVIKIGVADRQLVRIKPMDNATVSFSAFPDREYPATVTEISEQANPFTGTFDVELSLNDFHEELKNGFVGYVRIYPSKTNPYFKIPMTALIEGDDRTASLFTSEDQRVVQKREVKVQEIKGSFFTIDALQLKANDWLVLEGASYLSDRDTVSVIN